MNAGILSMQKVDNIGSLLQAYALMKLIKGFGADVDFIDIEPNQNESCLIENATYDFRKENDKGKRIDKFFLYRLSNKIRCVKQNKLYEDFRISELHITKERKNCSFNVCVIGSDEVFNCLSPSPWGFTSQLFGNVKGAETILTYAASCGATRYENLPEEVKKIIRRSFENIKGFSCRDSNTSKFVKKMGASNANIHLDPVLIYDFKNEAACKENIANKLPKKYCIVYSYQNRICNLSEINAIKKFAKDNNLELISIGQSQYWLPNHMIIHPFDAINAFQNAEFVITDTFHGTIFAAKYSKAFGVLTRPSNYNKLSDLVERLGIQNHLMNSIYELESKYKMPKTDISEIIQVERERTLDYLRQYCKE